jgi:hypothetical protein
LRRYGVRVHVESGDLRALGAKEAHRREAEAAARAGNDRDAAGEPARH